MHVFSFFDVFELLPLHQHKISEMSVKIDAARLLTWKAAAARDAGESYTKEAAMAKLFASEAATFCSHAVRVILSDRFLLLLFFVSLLFGKFDYWEYSIYNLMLFSGCLLFYCFY